MSNKVENKHDFKFDEKSIINYFDKHDSSDPLDGYQYDEETFIRGARYQFELDKEKHTEIINRNNDALITQIKLRESEIAELKEQIKYWEDKEITKASCCFANEQENITLKQKLDKAVSVLKDIEDLNAMKKELRTKSYADFELRAIARQALKELGE